MSEGFFEKMKIEKIVFKKQIFTDFLIKFQHVPQKFFS